MSIGLLHSCLCLGSLRVSFRISKRAHTKARQKLRTSSDGEMSSAYTCIENDAKRLSALEQFEGDLPTLPLNHGEVDPDRRKGFKKWKAFVASKVIAIRKTRI